MQYLESRGRKRVALLCISGLYDSVVVRKFESIVASRQFFTRPIWTQYVDTSCPGGVRQTVELLMHRGQEDRPDAMIIVNDQTATAASEGLLNSGVRVPAEMEVVAHCNFPHVTPCAVPAKRIGFDVRKMLETCLGYIDLQRAGKMGEDGPPEFTMMPAIEA
jgi:DNA-binding LacI/PurR family transcriptional regulator